MIIKPDRLNLGDTIGFIAPSFAMTQDFLSKSIDKLEELGFKTKLAENVYSTTIGFAGSVAERAADFNNMISDNEVKLIFFDGGEVSNEIIPYIDYENIKRHPKIIASYSDGTTVLNAVHNKTGLVTFYGASPRSFGYDYNEYNLECFKRRMMQASLIYDRAGDWQTVHGGKAEGKLIGGYLQNLALMQGGKYFGLDKNEKYILFIEDHECFGAPAVVSKYFSHLMQSGMFDNITGLIVGHYSDNDQPQLIEVLQRIGERYNIPVVKNDDFGHGKYNAIYPLGVTARLDADIKTLKFLENAVI